MKEYQFNALNEYLSMSAHDPGSMEDYVFYNKEEAMRMAEKIGLSGVHSHKSGDGKTLWMPGKDMQEFQSWYDKYNEVNGELLNVDNLVIPSEDAYIDFGEDEEIYDIAQNRPGLWENIRRKKEREGKNYRPAKPGDKDYPDKEAYKRAQKKSKSEGAEYQGRTVKLNKPFRTPDGPKKFSVYTKNEKGNVVKVNFGDPNMEIKRDDPARRKSFRARHNCDNPGPKWKARYWSCRNW